MVQSEILKLPRQYVINVIYTLVGEPFQKWVTARCNERHVKVAEDKDMYIEMDPKIAKIFRES